MSALSAVIETVNLPPEDPSELETTLAALDAQTLGRDQIEVICVVDPETHPGLAEALEAEHPDVEVIRAPGAWYYEQKNIGARRSGSDIVAFIDSDNEPVPTWASTIVDTFAASESIGVVQGAMRGAPGALGTAFEVTIFPRLQASHPRRGHAIAASNTAFRRRQLLEEPWKEWPVKHGPDVRMAIRERELGRRIVIHPGATARHAFVASLPSFLKRGVYWGYCAYRLRRDRAVPSRGARVIRATGPAGPALMAVAKGGIDLLRLGRKQVSAKTKAGAAGVLLLNAVAVAVGAYKARLGRPVPESPY